MLRHKVKSKFLASVGYDLNTRDLEVEFRAREGEDNRRVYRYHSVPAEKVTAMISAESIGNYFLTYIKPNHKCTRIVEEPHATEKKKDPGTPPDAA